MQFFLQKGPPPPGDVWDEDGATITFKPAYTELFSPFSRHFEPKSGTPASMVDEAADYYVVLYWIWWHDESAWTVSACLDPLFNMHEFFITTPSLSAGYWRALREFRPTIASLLERAAGHPANYDVSLNQFADLDTYDQKVFLNSTFGNTVWETQMDFVNNFAAGNSGVAVHRLIAAWLAISEEGIDPIEIPKLMEYIGGEVQKAELKQMLGATSAAMKTVLDFSRLFTG